MRHKRKDELTRWGLYGLIPLILGAVALWLSPAIIPQYIALDFYQVALVYLGVVIGFLAGTGEGADLRSKNAPMSFAPRAIVMAAALIAVLPQGTFFLSLPGFWRLTILLALLGFLLMQDLNASSAGRLPGWYGRLRMRLTLWAGLAVLLMMVRLMVWRFY